jgi:hypothetical protein
LKARCFSVGLAEDAERLIKAFHYSRRVPANVQCVVTWHDSGGLFGHSGGARAACLFSIPPTRWSEDVWELSRLVRDDSMDAPLSGLIAFAVKWIRKAGKIDLLVSFADRTQGHHGGIYQAANWFYSGQRDKRMDGVLLDGVFIPGRSCNSRWGTRSPEKLTAIIRRPVLPHFDEGKHLYWMPLFRSGERKADRLGLLKLPYPKPSAGGLSDKRVPTRTSREHTPAPAPFVTPPAKPVQEALI